MSSNVIIDHQRKEYNLQINSGSTYPIGNIKHTIIVFFMLKSVSECGKPNKPMQRENLLRTDIPQGSINADVVGCASLILVTTLFGKLSIFRGKMPVTIVTISVGDWLP